MPHQALLLWQRKGRFTLQIENAILKVRSIVLTFLQVFKNGSQTECMCHMIRSPMVLN